MSRLNSNRKNKKILIAGAGPAGASLAIRLAESGHKIVLSEREKFPRPKLCGEFVSPECLKHFEKLDVLDEMLASSDERISETVFYALNGKSVAVSSELFGEFKQNALGLSRAEMDFRLLEKAKSRGVEVLEETRIGGLFLDGRKIRGAKIRGGNDEAAEIKADVFVDATGRSSVLSNFAEREISRQNAKKRGGRKKQTARLVGFKAHLENVNLKNGACEIYFFRGGYGGLNFVENGRANHCFLIRAEIVKEFGGDADAIVENVICRNRRAAETLGDAAKLHDWLAVSVDNFGKKNLRPAENLFSIGDAGAFIDPFTGSGMLMAFESSEILAELLTESDLNFDRIGAQYDALHRRKFQKRLRVCAFMRRLAFVPKMADWAVSFLSFAEKPREILARSTRSV